MRCLKIGKCLVIPHIKCFTSSATSTVNLATTKVQHLVSKGLFHQTLELYKNKIHSYEHDHYHIILPSVIKASSSLHHLHFGLQLHSVTLKTASISDTCIANSLISMYAKCSRVKSASQLFDQMPVRDTITWSSIINCYLQNGQTTDAIETLKQMCSTGLEPKPELLASIISRGGLRLGKQIHARVVTNRDIDCVFLSTALLDMYARYFDLGAAYEIFKSMKERNEVSWTAMIAACNTNECYHTSFDIFRAMMLVDDNDEIKPNEVTLIIILQACGQLHCLKHGKEIHGYLIRCHYESQSRLAAALIEMYGKCKGRDVEETARLVFERAEERDVVLWSCMVGNYSRRGDDNSAIKLFNQMRMEGIDPNSVTLLSLISSTHGQAIHAFIVKTNFISNLYVGNSLIDMYAKRGALDASHQIFNEIPVRDSVSWSALIRGYGLHGQSEQALRLFHEMQQNQVEADEIVFLAILSACNHGGLVEDGIKIFEQMKKDKTIDLTMEHYGCYVDLLGRSGNVEAACKVAGDMMLWDKTRRSAPAIWSSLVSACKVYERLDVAKQLVHGLIDSEPDNPAHYTLASMVYSEIGEWDSAEEVQRVMKLRGLKKNHGYSRVDPDLFG